MQAHSTIALVGNPNCGKTTVFNALTGARQHVGNWPGVTVERKHGEYTHAGHRVEVVDLPGTYSLDVVDGEVSLDEKLARDYIHTNQAALIVNIVDAANLERNLYLTIELAEMGVPLLVVLNMVDVAEAKGLAIDPRALEAALGCPVVMASAAQGEGIAGLRKAVDLALATSPRSHASVTYEATLATAIAQLSPQLTEAAARERVAPHWLAVRLLEGDDLARQAVGAEAARQAAALQADLADDVDILVADARYSLANTIAGNTVRVIGEVARDTTERIDRVVLNRALGIPIFLAVMYLMFMFTINIGSAFIDFFDQAVGTVLVDGLGAALTALGAPVWLTVLVANGIGGGLQTVATFIPVIACLYLFLSVLEDSGYMARAAFVMDRLMNWMGLPGKSFVPLIVGFGCNVPAVMSTRTLERKRDRLMTMAMVPFMSCGARLPVYVLFAAAFFPQGAQNVVFALYLIGIAAAVVTGLALKRTLLAGESAPYIMELPPYHLPTVRGVAIHTWSRLKSFVIGAGRVIVPMVLVITALGSVGTDGRFGHTDIDKSVLAAVGRTVSPAFAPLGLNEDNWPATVGIVTGVLAKEAVVGTLDAAYSALADDSADNANAPADFSLWQGLEDAAATIPVNLAKALGAWADPLGVGVGDLSDHDAAAAEQAVSVGTFGAMASRFNGAAGAFAYLLFILLYMPCTATVAAIYQEAGPRWACFVSVWTTGLAFGLATLYYQLATFAQHPERSSIRVGVVVVGIGLVLLALRRHSKRLGAMATPLPQST
ncbi:Fe(2+) transporter permease subunit FeoB [Nitrogeniibacter mangrovi]|uniref:Ferrous iron transport protein B n=1 Tax=Nitrogeniibacter mangrovi TaxID=2016596 RepID=A0A6C1AY52_9RHOO|nr:Fe(2+) transporter permease subunit FeoB [Nitrogeniibacter mangrovi]QID16267.1 Fe(2+) transporter permease subunit FeoB [Nitrogeniibacter mangrovi]